MKRDKILYWITTGLVSLGFLASSMMYLAKAPELMSGFKQLGYPEYFVTILGVAKLTGGLALLNPWSPKLREWAYAGFAFVLIGAFWTHVITQSSVAPVLVFAALLATSYFFHQRVYSGRPQLMTR